MNIPSFAVVALVAAALVACVHTPSGTVAPASGPSALANPQGLPAVGAHALPSNPYRGQAAVAGIGRGAFNESCSKCHGVDAEPTPDAPDLRRLNSFCNRLRQDALKTHCLSDVDQHFMQSVLEGKVRAGLVHMPAWKGVLHPETIWSIRTYLETRKPPLPAKAPELNGETGS
jgi:mono/diheme cytochrome c family protein